MIKRKLQSLVGSISMIKKVIITIILIIVFAVLTAFSFWKLLPNGSVNKVQKETQSINNYMNDVGKEIIRCIKERDKKGISNIFCDKIKDTEYLNNEINIIFDRIDNNGGISIEDGEWTSPVGHGSNDFEGKTVEYLACKYSGIVKIGSTQYVLRFTAYQVLKKHIEYQGVHNIYFLEIVDKDTIREMNKKNQKKQRYLGMYLLNVDYEKYEWKHIYDKVFYENDLYLIPDNLEDDR